MYRRTENCLAARLDARKEDGFTADAGLYVSDLVRALRGRGSSMILWPATFLSNLKKPYMQMCGCIYVYMYICIYVFWSRY